MRNIKRVLVALLVADGIFLSYFWVLKKDEYFPGRYEDAIFATLIGLAVAAILIAILAIIQFGQSRRYQLLEYWRSAVNVIANAA